MEDRGVGGVVLTVFFFKTTFESNNKLTCVWFSLDFKKKKKSKPDQTNLCDVVWAVFLIFLNYKILFIIIIKINMRM